MKGDVLLEEVASHPAEVAENHLPHQLVKAESPALVNQESLVPAFVNTIFASFCKVCSMV